MVYWKNAADVIMHQVANPLYAHCIETTAYQNIRKSDGQPVIGEYMSAGMANTVQVRA